MKLSVIILPDKEIFRNPPNEYKGAPFWSINDRLIPSEIRRQIRLLNEGGFGGAFFHAREGLVTPYLSDEWFEAFKAAVDEAKKHNMYVWIYDELRWPSGFAGGYIPAISSKYRAKALVMIIDNVAFEGEDVIATFKCEIGPDGLPINYKPAKAGEKSSKFVYLTFLKYIAPIGDAWYSGFSYVDLLDPEVVRKFIEVAYQPYVDRFKDDIGKTIPGVFTDEPNISASRPRHRPQRIPPRGARFPQYALLWTDRLPEKFKELNGYDIIDKLPELFFDIGNYTKTRYDYWKTITIMFVEAFSKQIYEWCDKYGLKFTGHYLAEDTLLSQLPCSGATMPHYEYMHIPGIDHLGMQIWNTLLTAKQVASVANQLGKERVLCETYGCTGNYPSFEDRKWIGDWLYVLGVNFLNHHLVPYSMRGRRKTDYGLNFHWSQPWWKYNEIIEKYFARLSYVLSRGRRVVDVLVIHPMSSIWAYYSPLNDTKAKEIDTNFMRLLKLLLTLHVDFELGDELIIERHGKVHDGKMYIGRVGYNVVIIPPSYVLSRKTVELLKNFVKSGGILIAVRPTPTLIDGEPSDEVRELLRGARIVRQLTYKELANALKDIPCKVVIEGDEDGDILYHLREDEDGLILFIANVSREREHNVRIGIQGNYRVEDWNAFTGETSDASASLSEGKTWISVELEPVGSKLFILRPGKPEGKKKTKLVKVREVKLDNIWNVKRCNPNVLVLDYCRVCVDGAWSELLPVPRIHERLVQMGIGTRYALRFEFESKIDLSEREVYLVIENPKSFKKILVNGIELKESCGFWIDWNFAKYDISGMVGRGLNTIEIHGIVNLEPEIENIYILGDFGVKLGARGTSIIVEEKKETKCDDLCKEGYPFYCGDVELVKEVDIEIPEDVRTFLEVSHLKAALGVVYVNGKEVGKLLETRSSKIEITKFVKNGRNEVKILLVGTLRNTLGPLHYRDGDPWFTTPETFYYADGKWTDEYVLRPFGIEGARIVFYKEE